VLKAFHFVSFIVMATDITESDPKIFVVAAPGGNPAGAATLALLGLAVPRAKEVPVMSGRREML
jgi:hypothetical protein